MKPIKTIKERLEELRENATQKDFAHSLGVPLSTYTNWTRGISQPNSEWVVVICAKRGVSADWLLGLSDVKSVSQIAAGVAERATYDPPTARTDPDQAYWRDLVASQQATIAELTRLLSEGRIKVAAPVRAGGRAATKTA